MVHRTLRGSLTREEDQDVAQTESDELLDEFANADLENMEIGEESDNEAKCAYQAFLVAQRHAFDLYNQIPEKIRAKQKSTTLTYAFLQQGLFGDEQKARTRLAKSQAPASVPVSQIPARRPPGRPKALQAEVPRMQGSLFFSVLQANPMHCFLALKESMQHFALIQSLFCCCQFEFATECLGQSQL
eukprot:g65956.t1